MRIAAHYQTTILGLVRPMIAGRCQSDALHTVRTHCRRLQALLELCGDDERARLMAENVRRLSKLRAIQVFQQYLAKIEAPQDDTEAVDAWVDKQALKLRRAQVYQHIEEAVWRHALPTITRLDESLKNKLEDLRHAQEKNLTGLIQAAIDTPRRKRLHALRLALKTIRYQTEWLPGRQEAKQALVKRIKRMQAVLGRYEEMAEFRRWAEKRDLTVLERIQKDWKRARKRARAVPAELGWLVDAMASGHVWIGMEGSGRLRGRRRVRHV
jgi:CHAD domain-containing protein